MDINPGNSYLVSRSGEQFGPYPGSQLVQLAQNHQILAADHLWSEGQDGWVPAGSFNQLSPIFSAQTATAQPKPAPSSPSPAARLMESAPPMMSNPIAAQNESQKANVETAVDGSGGLHVNRRGVSGPGIQQAHIKTASEIEAEQPYRPGASFGLVLFSFILMVLGTAAYIGLLFFKVADHVGPEGKVVPSSGMLEQSWILYGVGAVMLVGSLMLFIVNLKYLHRAWAYIQDLPNVTTTPGKAVGFLFIPLFNIVWMFFAYNNWAMDYNLRCDLSHVNSAPKAKEKLFLAHCILCVIGLPILYLFVMHQMCRSINHLATSPDLELVSSYS